MFEDNDTKNAANIHIFFQSQANIERFLILSEQVMGKIHFIFQPFM